MIDFRYHALSLVAVFLALGIGIVLGVTVGDSLVSEADQNLRDSLRDDVTEAREDVRNEQELSAKRNEVIEEAAPALGEGRLRGTRIALIATGELPGDVSDAVEDGVESAGGELARTTVYTPPDRPRSRRVRRQERLGRRAGRRNFDVDAVVVYRHPPGEPDGEDGARDLELREAFEEGLFKGLRDNVVGVEALETDPSQVGWYTDQDAPSVDNIDLTAGRLALVVLIEETVLARFTDDDQPKGAYGYKDSADRTLPDLSD